MLTQVKAKSKEKLNQSSDGSVLPLPACEKRQKSPEAVARVDLAKSDALVMLPLSRQKEYLELKAKLVLHAKKQKAIEMAVKGLLIISMM